jgi:tetratricopeptide (TPR) repeat protein
MRHKLPVRGHVRSARSGHGPGCGQRCGEAIIGAGDARRLYHELRALKGRAEVYRHAAGEAFSQREIEKALRKPPYSIKFRGQAISEWIPENVAKAQVPHDADVVWALARLWCHWAGEDDPNERYWRNLVERAQPERIPKSGSTPVGRPISEYVDQLVLDDLEVHPAVEVGRATGFSPLPAYVPREHDARLLAVVHAVRGGQSGIALLVGGSSTGKTRACWEAVKTLPDGWRLWHPIEPNRAEAVIEQLQHVRPRTVVWLNETQHYLLDPERGEQVASGLRGLLHDSSRGPVLVLGTMWPEFWATLTAVPEPAAGPDRHAQARQLAKAKGVEVGNRFSAKELRDALAISDADPRLAEALVRAKQGEITQYLAGAPALIERYRTAPAAARALIEVAMDARRLGHGPDLPLPMLEAAVADYLSDREWDSLPADWLEQVLAYVTNARACRGAHSPLYRPRPRSGQLALAEPYYRLADYLEQHARLHRHIARVPSLLWNALANHANPVDCAALGEAACRRGLLRLGVRFYTKAAEFGDSDVYLQLTHVLETAGRTEEALAWYRYGVDTGHAALLSRAIGVLRKAGRTQEADEWLGTRAQAGDPFALGEVGRTEDALATYELAAQAGDPDALGRVGVLLQRMGRIAEAIEYSKRAARAGSDFGAAAAADLLQKEGRSEEVIEWLKECADRNAKVGFMLGMELLHTGKAQDFEEAFDWYQRAAEANHPLVIGYATNQLREMLKVDVVLLEDAIEWLEGLAGARNGESLGWAAELLQEAGQVDKALDWYRRSAEAGSPRAMHGRVKLLRQEGRTEEAIDWLKDVARKGDYNAMEQAAELLGEVDRIWESIDWLQDLAESGATNALIAIGPALRTAGRTDEAIDWYRRAANAGHSSAHQEVVDILREEGRVEEAARLLRNGWEPSGSVADDWEVWPTGT